ncbi:hypothetical protein HZB89_01010, partial [archaeon]|nr:hypothetical protein [archaeon]
MILMKELFIQLIALFVLVQFLGLLVASNLIGQEVKVTIINENPEDASNALGLLGYILGMTAVILLLIKFLPSYWIFKLIESLALLSTSFIVFGSIFNDFIGALGAIAILIVRNKYP